ncbi:MAG: PBP1A family penicillin-binding protein [bacterium]
MEKRPTPRTPAGKAPAGRPAAKAPAKAPARRKPPAKRKKGGSQGGGVSCLALLTGLFVVMIVFLITMAAVTIGMVSKYTSSLPELNQVVLPQSKETTKVYASTGEVIAQLYEENREYATFSEIPDSLKLAYIATEDERFFKHRGVDVVGLGRSAFLFASTFGRKRQGASTITQQLARLSYLTEDLRTENSLASKAKRKVKEWLLAIAIEKRYSKEEILEHYLNIIYLGHGAHGVKTAARIYFGKDLGELTIAESALLAALPKGPSIYTPYVYPDRAKNRRDNGVLKKMLALNFITQQEYTNAVNEGFHLAKLTGPGYENYKAPYFVTYLLDQLQDADGPYKMSYKQIYSGGYRIYTTLNMKDQLYAEAAVRRGIEMAHDRHANITQGAIVSMRPQTGAILAMVGGVDYKTSKFNRAWQALRQPGSSFKPFVYIAALKAGHSMSDPVSDGKVCYPSFPKPYCPGNYDNKYYGGMNYYRALVLSRNIPAVRVAQSVGIENVVSTAHDMGIKTRIPNNLSIALGAADVTVLDMAVAYSTMANGGYRVEPSAVERITDSTGAIIYQKKPVLGVKVLDDDIIAKIVPALEGVVTGGTGRMSRIDRPSAGKTGTTSEYRDAWFCGFVPQMTTIVWFGNDNNTSLRGLVNGRPIGAGVAGGALPAPVWALYMAKALKGVPVEEFKFTSNSSSGYSSHYSQSASGTREIKPASQGDNVSEIGQPGKKALEPDFLDFESEQLPPKTGKPRNGESKPSQPAPDNGTTNYDDLF